MSSKILNPIFGLILILLMIVVSIQENQAQIFSGDGRKFDINVGPLFRMSYDRFDDQPIKLNAVDGLVRFDRNKKRSGRPKIDLSVLGIGNQR
uniref:Uncharacterized protein n=1 Tax=Sarcoptes scabiei TaxID=52283 RepID=A0A834VHS1_SARSC